MITAKFFTLETSNLKHKSINGVAWNFVGKISTHIVTFIVSIFLARLLSREDFGMVAMAMFFISVTQAFMDFGLTTALIQKKNPTEIQINTVFYLNMMLAVMLMLILIACSNLIGKFYDNAEVASIAKFISYLFVIYAINGVQRAMLTKELKIKTLTIANLIGACVQGVSGIFMAFKGYGVWSLVYSNFFGSIITSIFLWYNSEWRPKLMFKLSEIKELFNFGYKMFFVKILDSFYVKLDELIIGKIFAADALGSYHRAKSFNNMVVSYTSDSLSGVFLPVISHLQDDVAQVKRVVEKSLEVVAFLVFGITALLYLNAESLIILLFGEKWLDSVGFFKVLAFVAYGFPVSVILVNVLIGLGKSGAFLGLDIIKKIIGLGGMAIGFLWGIYGFLWANVIITAIGVTINMWFVGRFINFSVFEQWKILFKYLYSALIISLLVLFINKYLPHNLFILLAVDTILFSVLYFLYNFIVKTNGFVYVKNIVTTKLNKNLLKK